jgi:hypothetical protein
MEHIEAAQQDRLDGEEIARDDARRLRAQKLAPSRAAATQRRLETARVISRRILVAETTKPSLRGSPQIRR